MSDNIKRLRDIAAGVRLYGAPDPELLASRIEAATEDLRAEAEALRADAERLDSRTIKIVGHGMFRQPFEMLLRHIDLREAIDAGRAAVQKT